MDNKSSHFPFHLTAALAALLILGISGTSAAAGEVGIEATGGELVIVRGSMDPGTIDGEMGPGGSLGEIYVAGNVAFAAGSALHIEVQGTDSDLLAVLGDIDLGAVGSAATLEFNWLPGGDGDSGSEFGGTYEILAYTGTLTGEFDSVSSNIGLPYFGGAPTLEDAIDYGDGTDDVISLNLWDLVTGDVTLDGIVNSSDFTIMAANWQDAGLWTEGNVNFDDIINSSDFTDMAANWQSTPVAPLMPAPPAAAFSAVPEPSTFVLALLGLLGIGAYRARRRKA